MPLLSGQSAALAPASPALEARNAIAGFFLTGVLLSFIGAILPAWRYHLTSDYAGAGACFLCLNAGLLAGARTAAALTRRISIVRLLSAGAFTATAAFVLFAFTLPPSSDAWRYVGSFLLGTGAGATSTALFYATTALYERNRASMLNLAGTTFGIGCALTALLVAGTYFVYSVAGILLMFAGIAAALPRIRSI